MPDTKPVAIRAGRLNDVPAIVAIEQNAESAAHWTVEQYNNLVDRGVVLIAEQAGNLCGFICAQIVAGEWEIENVVVASELLRRGVASELIGALIRRAREGRASAVLLEARESNLAARRFYEKHGFRQVGRRRLYYKVPEEDAILYELRLSAELA